MSSGKRELRFRRVVTLTSLGAPIWVGRLLKKKSSLEEPGANGSGLSCGGGGGRGEK